MTQGAPRIVPRPPTTSPTTPCLEPVATGGFDANRLQLIDRRLRSWINEGRVAGIACHISRHDEPQFELVAGKRDIEADKPMTRDTIFRLFSLSKPITAAAVMALLEDGELLLTDPVAEYLPEFADMNVFERPGAIRPVVEASVRNITIYDLLTHMSGFCYGNDPEHPVDRAYIEAELFAAGTKPIRHVTRKLAGLPLKHQPGTRFEYSVSYDVLGALVEAVADLPFGDFLDRRFFAPLGMRDTGFDVPENKRDRFAALYGPGKDDRLMLVESPQSDRYKAPVTLQAGGQGLVSTLPDYLQFVRMLYRQGAVDGVRCLSRKSVEAMTMNHLPAALSGDMWMDGYGYGLGVGVLLDLAAHRGLGTVGSYTWAGTASTYFWIDPAEGLVAILFTQFEPSSALAIPHEFRTLMYQALDQ